MLFSIAFLNIISNTRGCPSAKNKEDKKLLILFFTPQRTCHVTKTLESLYLTEWRALSVKLWSAHSFTARDPIAGEKSEVSPTANSGGSTRPFCPCGQYIWGRRVFKFSVTGKKKKEKASQ